jgi:hypothetical protein
MAQIIAAAVPLVPADNLGSPYPYPEALTRTHRG